MRSLGFQQQPKLSLKRLNKDLFKLKLTVNTDSFELIQ